MWAISKGTNTNDKESYGGVGVGTMRLFQNKATAGLAILGDFRPDIKSFLEIHETLEVGVSENIWKKIRSSTNFVSLRGSTDPLNQRTSTLEAADKDRQKPTTLKENPQRIPLSNESL